MKNYDFISEVVFLLMILIALVLHGCTKKIYIPVKSETIVTETVHDTIVDVRLEQSEKIVQVPKEDSVSILENNYAISKWERVDGIDYHYLWSKKMAQMQFKWKEKIVVKNDTVYVDNFFNAKARDRPNYIAESAAIVLSIAVVILLLRK